MSMIYEEDLSRRSMKTVYEDDISR